MVVSGVSARAAEMAHRFIGKEYRRVVGCEGLLLFAMRLCG
jgi:hypothetical protein